MSWLRRLSRDRSSKGDKEMPPFNRSSSSGSQQIGPKVTQFSPQRSQDMLSNRGQATAYDGDGQVHPPRDSRPNTSYPPSSFPSTHVNNANNVAPPIVPAPDPLTRVFNEALKPYFDKIEMLENELAGMQIRVAELEDEQQEVFDLIDQHNLRPNVPPSIARVMDRNPDAALLLSQQTDRKASRLDHDLRRLQQSLNDSLPRSHYTTALLVLIPDIDRLSSLPPNGARLAFDLVIKLGANLNAFGDSSSTISLPPANEPCIEDFYLRLDEVLIGICHKRLLQDGHDWAILRDVKRIERAEQNWKGLFGLRTAEYFPQSLDFMRFEVEQKGQAGNVSGSGSSVNRRTTVQYEK